MTLDAIVVVRVANCVFRSSENHDDLIAVS
jgi:hypothetical protein